MKSSPKRAKELIDAMFPEETSLEDLSESVIFIHALKEVRVEVPPTLLESWKKIDGYLMRKDPPHFQGDEYHVQANLPGGYEAGWGVSGKRRHPNKFPANVPNGLRIAAAKFLKVSPKILETWWIGKGSEKVLLFEVKE